MRAPLPGRSVLPPTVLDSHPQNRTLTPQTSVMQCNDPSLHRGDRRRRVSWTIGRPWTIYWMGEPDLRRGDLPADEVKWWVPYAAEFVGTLLFQVFGGSTAVTMDAVFNGVGAPHMHMRTHTHIQGVASRQHGPLTRGHWQCLPSSSSSLPRPQAAWSTHPSPSCSSSWGTSRGSRSHRGHTVVVIVPEVTPWSHRGRDSARVQLLAARPQVR